jgi:hypothetical protein
VERRIDAALPSLVVLVVCAGGTRRSKREGILTTTTHTHTHNAPFALFFL